MDPKYRLAEYAQLTEQQKAMIGATTLFMAVAVSGQFSTPEAAMQELVRTHNEVKPLNDIISLFEQHPDIFKAEQPDSRHGISVMRPVRLKL